MANPLLERYPRHGKYEGEINLTEWLDTAEQAHDAELGNVDGFGHYRLYTDLNLIGELGDLGSIRAAILATDSQGFVTATWYETNVGAKRIWDRLEYQYEKYCEEVGADD